MDNNITSLTMLTFPYTQALLQLHSTLITTSEGGKPMLCLCLTYRTAKQNKGAQNKITFNSKCIMGFCHSLWCVTGISLSQCAVKASVQQWSRCFGRCLLGSVLPVWRSQWKDPDGHWLWCLPQTSGAAHVSLWQVHYTDCSLKK